MKKLYEARLLIYSFGLLLSSTIERFITNAINEQLHLALVLYHTVSLVILIILFILTNVLLKLFINSKLITKRVFGNKYVGGRWIEFVYDENNEISGYCDLDIIYDEDKIYMSGTNYDRNFKTINSFETKSISMDNYDLSYLFVGREGSQLWQGQGNINFQRNSKTTPSRYSGHFFEIGRQYRVEGIKITDNSMIKKLDANFVVAFKGTLPALEAKL